MGAGAIRTARQTGKSCRLLAGDGRRIVIVENAEHRVNPDLAPDTLAVEFSN